VGGTGVEHACARSAFFTTGSDRFMKKFPGGPDLENRKNPPGSPGKSIYMNDISYKQGFNKPYA